MRFLIASTALMMMLAGCSGGGGLSSHVLTTGDLGSGYAYASLDDEEYAPFFEFLGMTSNPGTASGEAIEDDLGGNITAIYVAVIDHADSEGSAFSAAIRYPSAAEARAAGLDEFGGDGCGDPMFAAFVSGATIHVHDGESLPEDQTETFSAAVDKVQQRTGAVSVCDL